MTDGPTTPAKPLPAKRRGIANADVPSDTLGLPGIGEGASGAHFARDMVQGQAGEDDEESETHAPADPRNAPG